jgi:hypothetical protein
MGNQSGGRAGDATRRRRRRRATRAEGAPAPTPVVAAEPAVPADPPSSRPAAPVEPTAESATAPPPRKRRGPRDGGAERGLRDLVGAGRSQLGVSGALRGRDVNRPTDDDLAEAERDVVIVHRNWKPEDES